MRLPVIDKGKTFNREQLREKIRKVRQIIRYHRNQKGDNRCWLDDFLVWESVNGSRWSPIKLPPYDEMMVKCLDFWTHRQAETVDEVPPGMINNQSLRYWNSDLLGLGAKELLGKLKQLEEAIARHRDIVGRPRTCDDDRALYAVLPEKMPADFRLPPRDEFLGEAKEPNAGCTAFWGSHKDCPDRVSGCNVHAWGPCRRVK